MRIIFDKILNLIAFLKGVEYSKLQKNLAICLALTVVNTACSPKAEDLSCPLAPIPGINESTTVSKPVVVTPLDPACQSHCSDVCTNTFSGKDNAGIEINQGAIYNCRIACQAGRTSYYDYIHKITSTPGTKLTLATDSTKTNPSTISNAGVTYVPIGALVKADFDPEFCTPVNLDTSSNCHDECIANFNFDPKNENNTDYTDDIARCMYECAYNSTHTTNIIMNNGSSQMLTVPPYAKEPVKIYAKTDADKGVDSMVSISKGDFFTIRLDNSVDNSMYMCGIRYGALQPMITSFSFNDWNSNTVPPAAYQQEQLSNPMCADIAQDGNFTNSCANPCYLKLIRKTGGYDYFSGQVGTNKYDNRSLWYFYKPSSFINLPNLSILTFSNNLVLNPTDSCAWNARNYRYTTVANAEQYDSFYLETGPALGITPKDGDEFSLSWSGRYTAKIGTPESTTLQVLAPSSTSSNLYDYRNPYITLGENNTETDPSWMGLKRRVTTYNFSATSQGITEQNLSGNLSAFSPINFPFAVRHNDNPNDLQAWTDNVGGLTLKALWKGCPQYGGQGLQYQIVSDKGGPIDSAWVNLPEGVIKGGQSLQADISGRIYFRVAPLATPQLINEVPDLIYTSQAHRSGQYAFQVTKYNYINDCTSWNNDNYVQFMGVISSVVNSVFDLMFGSRTDPSRPGVVAILFDTLVSQSIFIGIVRALLVFYMTFFGLAFAMGLIQLNHNEMITRLIRVAFIIIIISPGAWEFLYTNFFQLAIFGPLELISIYTTGNEAIPGVCINPNDPASIFRVFDLPFSLMLSEATWIKIGGLIISTFVSNIFTGILIALVLIYAILIYIITIAKVIMMYLMSVVILATLIFISPIFFCLMLFQFTRSYFVTWWKYVLSFAIQPAVLFSVIAIFNLFVITTLNSALAFDTEKPNIVKIDIDNQVFQGYIKDITKYQIPVYNLFYYCKPKWPDGDTLYGLGKLSSNDTASPSSSSTPPAPTAGNEDIGGTNTGSSKLGDTLSSSASNDASSTSSNSAGPQEIWNTTKELVNDNLTEDNLNTGSVAFIDIIIHAMTLLIVVHIMYIFTNFAPQLVVVLVTQRRDQQSSITQSGEEFVQSTVSTVSKKGAEKYKENFALGKNAQVRQDRIKPQPTTRGRK
jgi:type IV secretory pathway VirB6-like protein